MSQLIRQNELKLDMLRSLSRSQRALATILETLSPTAITSEHTADQLLSLLAAINRHQQALTSTISLIPVRQVKRGKQGKVWLANSETYIPK